MDITIKNRWTGETIATIDAPNLRAAIIRLIASGADLSEANLSEANLSEANLIRANLSEANLIRANLSRADLSRADLSRADLSEANLSEADLSEANLSRANLSRANLIRANLSEANLSRADLSEANLSEADLSEIAIPMVPNLDAAILSAIEHGGRLAMDQWHTCETTHCRAGWAIMLAGDAGRVIESQIGSCAAGALIYQVSAGYVPNFYNSDDEALADIRAHAGHAE